MPEEMSPSPEEMGMPPKPEDKTEKEEKEQKMPNVEEALREAVAALYFGDSSDYKSALFSVVRALNPEVAKRIEKGRVEEVYEELSYDENDPAVVQERQEKQARKEAAQKLLSELKQSLEDWSKGDPELAEKVKSELIDWSGLEDPSLFDEEERQYFNVVRIPVELLDRFGIAYGTKAYEKRDKEVFSAKIIDFLKSKGIDSIIAVVDSRDLDIHDAMASISRDDGIKMDDMLDKKGWSWNCNKSDIEGWSRFESS